MFEALRKLKTLAARHKARKAAEALSAHGKRQERAVYANLHARLATELGRAPQSWRGR